MHYVVVPAIQVHPEFPSILRSPTAATQSLTCLVIVELVSRRPQSVPSPISSPPSTTSETFQILPSSNHTASSARPEVIPEEPESEIKYNDHDSGRDRESVISEPFVFNPTPPTLDSPFTAVTADLKARMHDWKGHALDGLGQLQMFDILRVRRDNLVREFYVYLFREALICVLEEKKKALGRLLQGSTNAPSVSGEHGIGHKGVLRLKGRIYVRHIKRIIDTSVAGELSLTIDMEDERLESFILVFKERSQLESWKTCIAGLVNRVQDVLRLSRSQTPTGPLGNGMEEFGGDTKVARMFSVGSGDTVSSRLTSHDSVFGSSQRSTMSSSTTTSSRQNGRSKPTSDVDSHNPSYHHPPLPTVVPHYSASTSNFLSPVQHTALDLICVISLPPPTANPSTASLKIRVIKNTFEFVLSTLGSRDRLSLVTFEVGIQGRVRKTPFLCPSRAQSKKQLTDFIETLARREPDDEFLVPVGKDEKTDVVMAVNHGETHHVVCGGAPMNLVLNRFGCGIAAQVKKPTFWSHIGQ